MCRRVFLNFSTSSVKLLWSTFFWRGKHKESKDEEVVTGLHGDLGTLHVGPRQRPESNHSSPQPLLGLGPPTEVTW